LFFGQWAETRTRQRQVCAEPKIHKIESPAAAVFPLLQNIELLCAGKGRGAGPIISLAGF
jgi:hypothetical protein